MTTSTNKAPIARNDRAAISDGSAQQIPVLENDFDPDGDKLSVISVTQGAQGAVTINADGTLRYAPASGFSGTDSFTYTISDGLGGSATATVTVTTDLKNSPPTAQDDTADTTVAQPVLINVLANDTDPDGDSLSVTRVGPAANGVVKVNADGTLTYVPKAGFVGTDAFDYTISDGQGGTATGKVSVNVTGGANRAPDAKDETAVTESGTPVSIPVLNNDVDPDGDLLEVTAASKPGHGTVVTAPDGKITYTSDPGFTGADSFTYTVSDGKGGSDTATVTVNVIAKNGAPDAVDDKATTDAGTPVDIVVLGNDKDPNNDPLTVTGTSDPVNGTATINANGTISYTPDANFLGTDSFTYTISDGKGGTDTATVTVSVVPKNTVPDAQDDTAMTVTGESVTIPVLSNDSDPDNDPLKVVDTGVPGNGTVTVDPAGKITYTPKAGFTGTDSFTYTISDGKSGTDTATVTVVVEPKNGAPDAKDDVYTTEAGTKLSVPVARGLLANDTDPDGDPLTVTANSDPANGTVTVQPNGVLSYTPDAGFTGTDSFTYTISDGNGGSDTATVTITVTAPANTAPDAKDDTYTTEAGTKLSVPVARGLLANDTDPEDDPLTVTANSDPANGTVTVQPNGVLSYTPDAGFTGTDSFTYTVSDGNGGTDTATVTITVTAPANTAPDAKDDTYTTEAGTKLSVPVARGLLANDTDPDGDPLTVTANSDPANGTVTVQPNGVLSYTPDAGFTGTDSFTYTISDGNGGSDTATVTITVTAPANTAPDAKDDTYTTEAGTKLSVPVARGLLANDTDPEDDPLTVTANSDPANGTVTVQPNGVLSYTPDAGFTGTDSFTYTVSDGNGGTDTATVTITVTAPANTAPDAKDDTYTTEAGTKLSVPVARGLLANDTDPEDDPLTVTANSDPANGTVTVQPNGVLSYTPDAGFTGTDSFTYTISDGNGGSDTATVTITVTAPANTAPDAKDDTYTTEAGTKLSVPVARGLLANDTDPEDDPLTVTANSDPANGTVTVQPNGALSYTPDAGFTGTDSFTYTVSDGNGGSDTATVTITVTAPANTAPDAKDDTYTTEAGTKLSVPVARGLLANDTDPEDDPLTVTANSDPANGTVTVQPNGRLSYIPDAGFTGTDSFTYTVSDGNGGTDTATVTITVTAPANTAPDAKDDTYTTEAGTKLSVPVARGLLANDTDPDGDPLTVTANSDPANGTVTVQPNGRLSYIPDAGFTGTDSFTYTVSDGNGGTDTATVTITVTAPANTAPDAKDDTYTTEAGTKLSVPVARGLLANDTDPDGDPLTVTANSDPANGTVTVQPNGRLSYIPDAGFTGTDSFTYTVSDGNGGTDTATVTITVTAPANTAPDAKDDTYTTEAGTKLSVPVARGLLANDTDPDGDPLTVTANSDPANGTVTVQPNGRLSYIPDAGFTGTDSFTYTVSDGNGGTDTATVTITVTAPANTAPDAKDDTYTTEAGTKLSVPVARGLLANDTDPEDDPLTVTANSDPANGTVTVQPNGRLSYIPDAGFTGTDSFTYTVSDGNGGTDTATVTITVTAPANTAPDAKDDTYTTEAGTKLSVPVARGLLANDTDPDGDPLTVTANSDPANGTVTVQPNGRLSYIPDAGFTGTDSFTYTVSDGNGGTDTATVTITVTAPANTAPDAKDDTYTAVAGTKLSVPVVRGLLANDTDPEDDPLTVTANSDPANGTVTVQPNGALSYTPDAGFTGTDSFTYTVSDGNGGTDTATVTVTVTAPANTAPDAKDDTYTAVAGTKLSVPVVRGLLANDTDPEDDPLTVTANSDPANGTVTVQPNGALSYTPDAGFTGTDSFTYTVSDGNGGSDTATVTITVTAPANTAPDAKDDTYTTEAGTPLDVPVATGLLANDTDPEDDPLTVTANSDPANGTVTVQPNGALSYTPDAGFTGTDSFTYTVSDGNGGTDTATVTVTVTAPANTAPDAKDDTYTAVAGTKLDVPVATGLLANDTDPEDDPLTVTANSDPANGTVTVQPNGALSYTPDAGFTGTDSFTYTVSDGNGGSDTATVTITVTAPANTAPDAKDDTYTTEAGTPLDVPVATGLLANDTDPEDDPLTVTANSDPANGTVTVQPNGALSYTPDAGFTGTDSFTYTVSDGNGGTDTATVTVTVTAPANTAPDAKDDTYTAVAGTKLDVPVATGLLANDTDPEDDPLTVTANSDPANGTVTVQPNGALSYTPDAGFTGTDSFTYTVSDGASGTDTATVTITVEDPKKASIGDRLWIDTDRDGVQDSGETGLEGVRVRLLKDGVDTGLTTTTGADGIYKFDNLQAGSYAVRFEGVDGAKYAFTGANIGDNEALDSDVSAVTPGTPGTINGQTDTFTLAIGQQRTDVDGGLVARKAKIGDFVWKDVDGDGQQDSDEPGVSGVKVTLIGAGVDGRFGTADDTTATTTTDANGKYSFDIDKVGSYKVRIDIPDGFTVTKPNVGSDATDSDFLAVTPSGAQDLIVNGGFENPAVGTPSFFDSIPGWTAFGDKLEIGLPASYGVNGANGKQVLELDAKRTFQPSGIYQEVMTKAGETYTLSLDVAQRAGFPSGSNTVEVYWRGAKIATIDPESTTLKTYTFKVEGSGGKDRLEFREALGDDDSVGGIIDNVKLVSGTAGAGAVAETDTITVNTLTDNLTVDAGLVAKPKDVCASIVGDGSIREGEKGTYSVKLEQAVSTDTFYTIKITDGSAHRVDKEAGNQDVIWDNYYNYFQKSWLWWSSKEIKVYDRVPNGSYFSDGDRPAVGPGDTSWDYTVYKNGVINMGDTLIVKIAAGQTTSESFTVNAWKEKVTVDLDASSKGYNEGTENFNLSIAAVTGSDQVTECKDQTVSIIDTTSYFKVSPIAIDLNGDGIQTTALGETSGTFDMLNNGKPIETGWLSKEDGFLAVDQNGNGKIDDRSELFGGNKGEGFAQLATFDSNDDGVVDSADSDFGDLRLWQDANQNHQTDAGELKTLEEAGVLELNVAYEDDNIEQNGNYLMESSTATLADGTEVDMVDVYFNMAPSREQLQGSDIEVPDLGDLLGDDTDDLDELLPNNGSKDDHGTCPPPAADCGAKHGGSADLAALKQLTQLHEDATQGC